MSRASRIVIVSIASIAALALVPVLAAAQSSLGYHGWGPRVGVTSGPSQFHIGAGVDLGDFVPNLRFQPNVEVGFGNSQTIATFNAETAYYFPGNSPRLTPFFGGGIGLDSYGYSDGSLHNNTTDVGLNVLGGLEFPTSNGDSFDTEAKIGLTNAPDFKLTFSYIFR